VVRITPDEVHLSDPENCDQIYSVGKKYDKSSKFYRALRAGYSTFTEGPAAVHKPLRARLDPFFSRQNVLKMEHLVVSRVKKLEEIMTSKFSKDEAVDLHHAFRAISVDVISDYAFGESYELLAREDLGREFWDLVTEIGPTWCVFQQWPMIQQLALSLPETMAKAMSKPLKQVLNLMEVASLYPSSDCVVKRVACSNSSTSSQSEVGCRTKDREAMYLRSSTLGSQVVTKP
jgi:cytochrome P450